ncbi:MAG: hypothetical protein AAF386_07495, partial [Pseudomonadota bacterium]
MRGTVTVIDNDPTASSISIFLPRENPHGDPTIFYPAETATAGRPAVVPPVQPVAGPPVYPVDQKTGPAFAADTTGLRIVEFSAHKTGWDKFKEAIGVRVEKPVLGHGLMDAQGVMLATSLMEGNRASTGFGGTDEIGNSPVGRSASGGFWDRVFGSGGAGGSGSGGSGGDDDDDGPTTGGGGSKPVLMDLNRNGLELNFDRTATFDIDGDGFREGITWAAADDGILAIDLADDGTIDGAGDGLINQADEIAFANWGTDGMTDMEALAHATDANGNAIFDSNQDGHLNAQDQHWAAMKVFQDANQDGDVDAGELQHLSDWGITDINLFYDDGTAFSDRADDVHHGDGTTTHGTAAFTQNGELVAGAVHDMTLGHDLAGTRVVTIGGVQMLEHDDGSITPLDDQTQANQLVGTDMGDELSDVADILEHAARRENARNWGVISGAVAAGVVATDVAAQDAAFVAATADPANPSGDAGLASAAPLAPNLVLDSDFAAPEFDVALSENSVEDAAGQAPLSATLDAAETIDAFVTLDSSLT